MAENNSAGFAYDDPDIVRLVRRWLNYDALAAVEKLTGKHHSEPGFPEKLALLGFLEAGQGRNAALRLAGDTLLSMEVADYLAALSAEGFRQIYEAPFNTEGDPERLLVFWHNDGILLAFDTFRGNSRNGGHFWYNWRPTDEDWHRFTSSGHEREDGVWVGNHDCREALRLHLHELRAHGSFVSPWIEMPFLWVRGYGETDADQARHLAALPEDVRRAMGLAGPEEAGRA